MIASHITYETTPNIRAKIQRNPGILWQIFLNTIAKISNRISAPTIASTILTIFHHITISNFYDIKIILYHLLNLQLTA